jgi:hypothetical protein
MTISASATISPLAKLNGDIPVVDIATGNLTAHGMQVFNGWYNHINGMNRIIPCNASGQNVITLTPLTASPLLEKYNDFDFFAFVAADSSTGAITATVAPRNGTLSTLKVYNAPGTVQASTGDIGAGGFYMMAYVDSLDSGAGGFVLK